MSENTSGRIIILPTQLAVDYQPATVYTDVVKYDGGGDMASKAAIGKYDAANTVQVKMKLNKRTDADILDKLNKVGNKQGYIKSLIRENLKAEQ